MELTTFRRFTGSEHNFEFSPELVDQWIKEIRDVAPNEIKIGTTRGSPATNGNHFIPPLNKILIVLHQLLIRRWNGDISILDEETKMATNKQIQFSLRQLASDTIPHLIMYMKNISMNVEEMSRHLLDVLTYLVALDHTSSLCYPTLYASCLLHMCQNWSGAVDVIMKHLCYYVLPLVLLYPDDITGSAIGHMSMSATLMLVLGNEFCNASHHMMIAATLMRCKKDVCSDLLSVIAYGTKFGRNNALKVLGHYWPLDYEHHAIFQDSNFPDCEFSNCSNKVDYLCLEGSCALQHSKKFSEEGKKKLFLLLCSECNGKVHRTNSAYHKLVKITPPLRDIKPNCELRLVCSKEEPFTRAEVTCFGEGCTSIQDGYPVRMCTDCHKAQHTDLNDPLHVFQVGPQNPWTCTDPVATSIFLEAVTKLLSATPTKMDRKESRRVSTFPTFNRHYISDGPPKKVFFMLQQYLIPDKEICDDTRRRWFERIIALVLEWLLVCHELLEDMREEGMSGTESIKSYHGSLLVNFQKTVEGVCSNHHEIHDIVVKHIIPWLKSVCTSGNTSCIATALQPESPGHVQVGRMWEHSHEAIDQYRRTLSLLVLITQDHFLTDEASSQVYSEVMPQWMELLVNMRSTPGQMEKLKDLLFKIFPRDAQHDRKQIERFEFIRQKFRQKNSEARQRALFWLQDLSRLKIVVPYTTHIFDDIFHKRTLRRASRPNPDPDLAMPLIRKESTGSFSGYESESPLVSQFSIDNANPSNTQAILNLNFALPKYIVMLDIWNSQLNLHDKKVPLEFESFQRFACHMLDKDWDGDHSSSDHIGSFNTCLFCQALAMWFSLASHITNYYSQLEDDPDEDIDGEQGTPPSKGRRVSKVFRSSNKKKSRANTIDNSSTSSINTPGKMDPTVEDDSLEFFPSTEHKKSEAGTSEGMVKPSPRDRRRAMIASHSQIEFNLEGTTPPSNITVSTEEQLPQLYLLFQFSVKKLHPHYHPDSLILVVTFINILVTKLNVLKIGIGKEVLIQDVHKLFDKLWKILEGSVSFLSQSCVTLLLACQGDIVELEVSSFDEISSSRISKAIGDGFSQKKWKHVAKTVDKLTAILQFMTGVNEGVSPSKGGYHKYIDLALGIGFCQMTRLLQSKDTIVTTRVEYCLKSFKKDSVEAIQDKLLLLFVHVPLYRFAVIQTLSLLSSAIPEVPYLSLCLNHKLLTAVDGLTRTRDTEEVFRLVNNIVEHPKRTSSSSVLSGRYHKDARPSITSSAFSINLGDEDSSHDIMQLQCDTISLLLKFISSTKSDFKDMTFQTSRTTKKSGTIFSSKGTQEEPTPADQLVSKIEQLVCRRFLIAPKILCQQRVFETFIVQAYKMLDKNTDFCETKTMIPFILRLLGYAVSPTRGDYPYLSTSNGVTSPTTPSSKDPLNTPCSFTLGNLPNKLQAPWLRVLFIILYKYTEKVLPQSDSSEQYLQWCIDIVLSTLLCSSHVCPGQAPLPRHSKGGSALIPESPSSPASEGLFIQSLSETPGRPRPQQQQGMERATLETVPEESGSFNSSHSKPKPETSEPTSSVSSRPPILHTASVASLSGSLASAMSFDHQQDEDLQHPGRCLLCHASLNVFSEEVVALGVLVLGTCAHHAPNLVSLNLVTSIIPSIARVVIPGNYYWQDSSISDPPPGSAMSLAKQFLLTLLTQFAERRMFLYLLRHNHQKLTETVFKAVTSCLPGQINEDEQEEEEPLTHASPVQYFLEDADSSTHFTSDLTGHSLINLACYLEIVPDTSAHLFVKLNHLDAVLKKLKQPECKKMLYNEETFRAFLKITIQLLKFVSIALPPGSSPLSFATSSTIHAIYQEFPDILLEGLQMVHFPTGALVTLVGMWYKAFVHVPAASRRREVPRKFHLLKLLVDQFHNGLTSHTLLLPHNLISMSQTFLLLLNEYVFLGYIDTLTPDQRVYAPHLIQLEQEVYLSSIVNSDRDTTGIYKMFTDSMCEALQYLACIQPRAAEVEMTIQVKLTVAQLVALRVHREREPHGLVTRILHGNFILDWMQKRIPTADMSKSKVTSSSVCCFVGDNISSLQVLGWLLLGAMCHNAIHNAIQRINVYGKLEGVVTGDCEILVRLCNGVAEATDCVLHHVKKALEFIVQKSTYAYYGLKTILCFSTIWTVYMETSCKGSLPYICHFWQLIVSTVIELPSKEGMLLCNEDIVGSFCEQTIIPLKRIRAACVPLLQPTWKRVINMLNDPEEAELPNYLFVDEVSMDVWMREMLITYVELESKYLPN